MTFRLIVSIFLTLTIFHTQAQTEQPLRVEIEMENDKAEYSVVPAGKNGLVMYHLTDERVAERNKVKWIFAGYNNLFRQTWKSAYVIGENYGIRQHYYDNGVLYLLFAKHNREQVILAIIDVATGKIRSVGAAMPKKFIVHNFRVFKDFAYINGSHNKKGEVGCLELKTGHLTIPELKFDGTSSFESIDIDTLHSMVNIVYSVTKRKDKYLSIKSLRGNVLTNDLSIKPEGNDNLLTGKITSISENEKVIVGTYAVKGSSGSNGVYFARLINDSEFVIKYYNFTDFERFFDFMSQREKERIEKKKLKRESKGKELNLDYQLLTHDLIEKDGRYLMIAEAYYPTYRSEPYTYTTVINGVPVMQTRYVTVFDGWLYTHGIVAAFDKEGNMLWDNSIEMGDFKTFELEPRVSVKVEKDEVTLAYGTYDNIKTKLIRGNEVIDAKDDVPVKTGSEDDVVKRGVVSSVRFWYDNYFLVWGYQKIRNDNDDGRRRRTVFYFNKIAYK